jgi:hypothetical protein
MAASNIDDDNRLNCYIDGFRARYCKPDGYPIGNFSTVAALSKYNRAVLKPWLILDAVRVNVTKLFEYNAYHILSMYRPYDDDYYAHNYEFNDVDHINELMEHPSGVPIMAIAIFYITRKKIPPIHFYRELDEDGRTLYNLVTSAFADIISYKRTNSIYLHIEFIRLTMRYSDLSKYKDVYVPGDEHLIIKHIILQELANDEIYGKYVDLQTEQCAYIPNIEHVSDDYIDDICLYIIHNIATAIPYLAFVYSVYRDIQPIDPFIIQLVDRNFRNSISHFLEYVHNY